MTHHELKFFSAPAQMVGCNMEKQNGAASDSAYGLTEREWQVARLVTKGKRNAEIADALAMSVFTVETHLKKIYKKVRVRSRTELARWVGENDG